MRLVTSKFKTTAAKLFVDSFSSSNTVYYMGAHRSLPFVNDSAPPNPINSVDETHYNLYDELILGKHITTSDVALMARNIPWVSGTVYEKYDNTTADLETKNFYVVSPEGGAYHVFKCLDNNGGAPSTVQPLESETDPEDEVYKLPDGYQWKYMYTISSSQYSKFASSEYIPVFENSEVKANARPGAIETIVLSDPGRDYNSYASGTVKTAAFAGNTFLYTLNGDKFNDFLLSVPTGSGFIEEKVRSVSGSTTATGVVVSIFAANTTHDVLRVTNVAGNFYPTRTLTGLTSNTSAVITTVEKLTSALSSDADFYKNGAFYIRSGAGAGQVRTITEYIVSGEERIVLLNAPLSPLPDRTSVFEIGPRVIIRGDGSGAAAIATVDPTRNGIHEIEILSSGQNYTFASIDIIANTGLIDARTGESITASGARARAIIPPEGGHGSDVVNELYANRVGISVTLANTENQSIPTTNDFRKLSLIKNPLFANVVLQFETTVSFPAGDTLVQTDTGATGKIFGRSGNTVTLTDVLGFFETGNTTTNVVVSSSNNLLTGVVTVINPDSTKNMSTFDQRQTFQCSVQNGPTGSGFVQDEMVIQEGFQEVQSDLVRLTLDRSALIFSNGDSIVQNDTNAVGTVSSRFGNVLTVTNITGTFAVGNTSFNEIYKANTAITAAVENVDNTFQANAVGYVHTANSSVISLVGVNGVFNVSDLSGDINTFIGQTSGAIATLTGRDYSRNFLVDGSGEYVYVENFIPIQRAASQSEKAKIIIEF